MSWDDVLAEHKTPANSAGGASLFPSGGPVCCPGFVSGDCVLWQKWASSCSHYRLWSGDLAPIDRWMAVEKLTSGLFQLDSSWLVWSCYWLKHKPKAAQAVQYVLPIQTEWLSLCRKMALNPYLITDVAYSPPWPLVEIDEAWRPLLDSPPVVHRSD